MAEHDHRECGGAVVVRRQDAAAQRTDAERREVRSADVLHVKRPGRVLAALLPDAQLHDSREERGRLLELWGRRLQPLVERKREHAPATLRATFNATGVGITDSVQTS